MVIAAAVALIGYAQWRTTNQRVVMDLFEKRLAVVEKLKKVMREVIMHGACNDDVFNEFVKAERAIRCWREQ